MPREGRHWDEEAEVVVVGYGGAGAVAAISAHDAGARVLILEKQPADTPTTAYHTPSTRMSGGGWLCPSSEEGIVQYLEGMVRIANETLDEERKGLIGTFAHHMVDNTRWMESIGGEVGGRESVSPTLVDLGGHPTERGTQYAEFPELPGSECCHIFPTSVQGLYRHGASFFKYLSDAVQKRGLPVLWETPGRHLVTQSGKVSGVLTQRGKREIAIRATRAVILTCGGFEFDEAMKQNYLRVYPSHFYGNPASTGEGVNMALEVGAGLWHMNCASWRVVMKFPEFPIAFGITPRLTNGGLLVDRRGQRFANERFKQHAFGYELTNYDSNLLGYPRVPCYWIFDQKRKQAGPLASLQGPCNPPGGVAGPNYHVWSQDNEAELERRWVFSAPTLQRLAAKLAVEPENRGLMRPRALEETVAAYHRCCEAGEDPDFRRPPPTLVPLDQPPYYAVKLWPGGPNTQGGPKRNSLAQVLRPDNTPVPRLYAAGELGSVWSMFYQGGGSLAECLVFGRLAGANAAQEKRHS